jgi:PBSX family phage terminase large subunit
MLSIKQIKSFNEATARINIWQGAVRSGKTYVSLIAFLTAVSKGPQGEYAILTRTYDSFVRNILPQIMRLIGGDARHYSGKRELMIWGKRISVIGCEDDRAEYKIRGSTFCGAYVDEATIIPESCFKQLISRCVMGGAQIFTTTNPDSPYHWFKKDFLEGNPDVNSWAFTLDDNPELKQDEKNYLKRQYKGIWYKRFIEGLWVMADGCIYDFFDINRHVITHPPGTGEYICGVDYGTSNPSAYTLIGINKAMFPNMWVEKVYLYDSKVHQRQLTDTEQAEALVRFIEGYPVRAIYVDPSAASFKLELYRHNVQNLYDANNDVLNGIRMVANFLNTGTIKICQCCTPLIKEMQSYCWDSKASLQGIDKPLKVNDHCVDSLRYALATHFMNKSTSQLTPQEIDKMYHESTGGGSEWWQQNG